MKNYIALVVAMVTTMCAMAQSPVSFSVRAGLNINSLRGEDNNFDEDKNKLGFNLGALAAYNFVDMFGVQSGLLLNTRGKKEKVGSGNGEYISSISIYELQAPVFLTFQYGIGDDFKYKANAGPTLGMGLSANSKKAGKEQNLYKKDGSSQATLKRFNFGLAFGAGIEFKRIYLGVGYDLGLTDISNNDAVTIKTGSLSINAGFTF